MLPIILNLFISCLITIGAYFFIPLILLALNKTFHIQTLKWICVLNAALIFVMFSLVNFYLGSGSANFGSCILWGVLSYRLLKKHCIQNVSKEEPDNTLLVDTTRSADCSFDENQEKSSKIIFIMVLILVIALIVILYLSYKEIENTKNENYALGYDVGYAAGNDKGYANGYDEGYDAGHKEGRTYGYEFGYRDGYDAKANEGKRTTEDYFKKYGNSSRFP